MARRKASRRKVSQAIRANNLMSFAEEYNALSRRQQDKFAEGIARLPEVHRMVILSSLQGEKQYYIGSRLGVSQPRVSKILHAAIEMLHEIISTL